MKWCKSLGAGWKGVVTGMGIASSGRHKTSLAVMDNSVVERAQRTSKEGTA